jgi:hypothetical protein
MEVQMNVTEISESTLNEIKKQAGIWASKYKNQWSVPYDDWYQEVWLGLLKRVKDTIDSVGKGDPYYFDRPYGSESNSYALLNTYAKNKCADLNKWWRRRHYSETSYDEGITGGKSDGPTDPANAKRVYSDMHIRNVDKYDIVRREDYDDGDDDDRISDGKRYTDDGFSGKYESSNTMTARRFGKTFKNSDTSLMINEMYSAVTKKFGVASREWYFFTGMMKINDLIDYVAKKIPIEELRKVMKVTQPLDIAADLMKVGKTGNSGYIKAAQNVRDLLTKIGYTL